jgi:hypothetical protein
MPFVKKPNISETGELDDTAVISILETTADDGKT